MICVDFCGTPFAAVFICPASDLQSAGNHGHAAFGEILSDKLAGLTPCDTVDKIGICFAVVAFDIPIHCYSEAGNGDAVSGSAQFRISGQSTHDGDMV